MYNIIIYNSIVYNITPNVKHIKPARNINNLSPAHTKRSNSNTNKPNTDKTYTPQPSTPIKHAGSDILE